MHFFIFRLYKRQQQLQSTQTLVFACRILRGLSCPRSYLRRLADGAFSHKVIEEFEYLSSVANGRQHTPGFAEAIDYVSVQDAMLRSWKSEKWETVERLSPRD